MKARAFDRIIGIDSSGSNRPTRRISGLAVCSADVDAPPHIVCGPKEGSQNWTRKEIAKWLVEQLREKINQLWWASTMRFHSRSPTSRSTGCPRGIGPVFDRFPGVLAYPRSWTLRIF